MSAKSYSYRRWGSLAGAVLLLSTLTGCGDQAYNAGTMQSNSSSGGASAPPSLPPAPAPPAVSDPLTGSSGDPLAGGDALAGDQGGIAPTVNTGPADPLASSGSMPTDHSHWLTGDIFDAQVTVALNGNPIGQFDAPVDKDITMLLRRGINTVTFTYTPTDNSSSAQLEVQESEHHPPIPPLAIFRSPSLALSQAPQPITVTDTFVAH